MVIQHNLKEYYMAKASAKIGNAIYVAKEKGSSPVKLSPEEV
jgi:hypothetical protein